MGYGTERQIEEDGKRKQGKKRKNRKIKIWKRKRKKQGGRREENMGWAKRMILIIILIIKVIKNTSISVTPLMMTTIMGKSYTIKDLKPIGLFF